MEQVKLMCMHHRGAHHPTAHLQTPLETQGLSNTTPPPPHCSPPGRRTHCRPAPHTLLHWSYSRGLEHLQLPPLWPFASATFSVSFYSLLQEHLAHAIAAKTAYACTRSGEGFLRPSLALPRLWGQRSKVKVFDDSTWRASDGEGQKQEVSLASQAPAHGDPLRERGRGDEGGGSKGDTASCAGEGNQSRGWFYM